MSDQMNGAQELNRQNVTRLVKALGDAVQIHLKGNEVHPYRVLEALNALAVIAGILQHGTGFDPRVIKFFKDACSQQLDFEASKALEADHDRAPGG